MKLVKLSIITVVYNNFEMLKKTVENVSFESQGITDIEHLIVDGASNDGTLEYLRALCSSRLRYVSEPDSGIYDAMNKGIKMAKGIYLQFLNAGDIYRTGSLSRLYCELNGITDVFIAPFITVDAKYREKALIYPKRFLLENLKVMGTDVLNHQSIVVKRSIAPEYATQYRLKGELNWYLDLLEMHPSLDLCYLDTPLVLYRVGGLGSQHRFQNLWEWIRIVNRRFGLFQHFKNLKSYLRYIKVHNRYAK